MSRYITMDMLTLAWASNMSYHEGQWVITPSGGLAQAKLDHNSGDVYDSNNWNESASLGTGPQGAQGIPGPQGPPGADGAPGAAGSDATVTAAAISAVRPDLDLPALKTTFGVPLTGPLANMPANGSQPDGSTYFATDQFGGTLYEMVAGAWVQTSAGVNQASGQMIAGPAQLTAQFDVKAVGMVVTDIPGMSIAVPASSRPVLLRAKFEIQANSGTSAAGAALRLQLQMTDNANAIVAEGMQVFVQVVAAAVVYAGQIYLEAYLPAPVVATTYKIRAVLLAAAPANWTSAYILPANGAAAVPDNFYAVTC